MPVVFVAAAALAAHAISFEERVADDASVWCERANEIVGDYFVSLSELDELDSLEKRLLPSVFISDSLDVIRSNLIWSGFHGKYWFYSWSGVEPCEIDSWPSSFVDSRTASSARRSEDLNEKLAGGFGTQGRYTDARLYQKVLQDYTSLQDVIDNLGQGETDPEDKAATAAIKFAMDNRADVFTGVSSACAPAAPKCPQDFPTILKQLSTLPPLVVCAATGQGPSCENFLTNNPLGGLILKKLFRVGAFVLSRNSPSTCGITNSDLQARHNNVRDAFVDAGINILPARANCPDIVKDAYTIVDEAENIGARSGSCLPADVVTAIQDFRDDFNPDENELFHFAVFYAYIRLQEIGLSNGQWLAEQFC